MLSEEEQNAIEFFKECIEKDHLFEEDFVLYNMNIILNLINRLQQESVMKIMKQDLKIKQNEKLINLMATAFYKKYKAELLLEYGFENKKELIKYFSDKINKTVTGEICDISNFIDNKIDKQLEIGTVVQFNFAHKWCGSFGYIYEIKGERIGVAVPIPQKGIAYIFTSKDEFNVIGKTDLLPGE